MPYVEPWPIGGFSDLSTFKSVLLAFFIAFFSFFIFLSIFDLSFFLPMALLRFPHPTVGPTSEPTKGLRPGGGSSKFANPCLFEELIRPVEDVIGQLGIVILASFIGQCQ